jgi:hypothetical protein
MMQKIFKVDVSPDVYQSQDKSFPFPDLTHTLCPQCHKRHLHLHGFYRRYLIARGFEGIILIRRYICLDCGGTVSLLPWFCHPRRTYSMGFIHYSLSGFFDWPDTMISFIRKFILNHGIIFTRQLLYHFRKRILKNCNRIMMDLVRQFNPDGPISASLDNKKRVKDALNLIETAAPTPYSVSMDMFSHGSRTYLTLSAL